MMRLFTGRSLRTTLVVLTSAVSALALLTVVAVTSITSRQQLQQSVLHDLASRNRGYVDTIATVLHDRATVIKAVRDDLELYESRGQMWVHIAARTGEKVFYGSSNPGVYAESFHRKLNAYLDSDQLSGPRMTPQIRSMLPLITIPGNSYGDGMKFFYIGARSKERNPRLRAYDEYQDSSLWVPDPRVDEPYSPFDRPWYVAGQEAGRDRVVFTEPYAERRTREALVSGGTSIKVEGTRGTLAAGLSIAPIIDTILGSSRTGSHISVFSHGTARGTRFVPSPPKYVYSTRDSSLGTDIRVYNDPAILTNPANRDIAALYDATQGRGEGVLEWTVAGEERLVAYNTVPMVRWKVFSSVAKDAAMADVVAAQNRNLMIAGAGLVVLVGLITLLVTRALRPLSTIRRELAAVADSGDLSTRTSVTTRDEVGQMAQAINAMLDNIAAPVRDLGDKVQRIAAGDLGADTRVAAKGDIATLVDGFNEMTRRLIELEATYRDASPLTGLPGGVTIELEVQRRIENGIPFAFCMFDLDDFKPFNDRYGYSRGNLVLKQTARLIQAALSRHGRDDDFVGHVGGDDFVVVAAPRRFEAICRDIITGFDDMIPQFYDAVDLENHGITSRDRRGEIRIFPLMSLSICAVLSDGVHPTDYIRVGEVAAELKARAKTLPGSNLMIDRRAYEASP